MIGDSQVVRPDIFSFGGPLAAVTGPCSRDGTATDVVISAGAITIVGLSPGEKGIALGPVSLASLGPAGITIRSLCFHALCLRTTTLGSGHLLKGFGAAYAEVRQQETC